MEDLKINNFVKIKKSAFEEDDMLTGTDNFQGKIREINKYEDNILYLIELDSQSLDCLSDNYIVEAVKGGEVYTEYNCYGKDLKKAERRDADKQYEIALDRVEKIETAYWEKEGYKEPEIDDAEIDNLIDDFENSEHFEKLNNKYKEEVAAVVTNFSDFAVNYCYTDLENFTQEDLQEICLELIPRKVFAEVGFFEAYSPVMIRFLYFLKECGIREDIEAEIKILKEISKKIVSSSQDKTSWGMAKNMAMSAQEGGFDPLDEQDMADFIEKHNANIDNGQNNPNPIKTKFK